MLMPNVFEQLEAKVEASKQVSASDKVTLRYLLTHNDRHGYIRLLNEICLTNSRMSAEIRARVLTLIKFEQVYVGQ